MIVITLRQVTESEEDPALFRHLEGLVPPVLYLVSIPKKTLTGAFYGTYVFNIYFLLLILGYGSENSERDRSASVDYQHCQRAGRKYSFRKRK